MADTHGQPLYTRAAMERYVQITSDLTYVGFLLIICAALLLLKYFAARRRQKHESTQVD